MFFVAGQSFLKRSRTATVGITLTMEMRTKSATKLPYITQVYHDFAVFFLGGKIVHVFKAKKEYTFIF